MINDAKKHHTKSSAEYPKRLLYFRASRHVPQHYVSRPACVCGAIHITGVGELPAESWSAPAAWRRFPRR